MATTNTLLRTDEAWNGEKLPDHLVGKPEIVIKAFIIPLKLNNLK